MLYQSVLGPIKMAFNGYLLKGCNGGDPTLFANNHKRWAVFNDSLLNPTVASLTTVSDNDKLHTVSNQFILEYIMLINKASLV
jgi:hypothetical protein